jgi:cell division protein FtsB
MWTTRPEEIHSLLDRLRVARGECQALLADVDARRASSRTLALEAEHDRLEAEVDALNREIDTVLDELHALLPRQRQPSEGS